MFIDLSSLYLYDPIFPKYKQLDDLTGIILFMISKGQNNNILKSNFSEAKQKHVFCYFSKKTTYKKIEDIFVKLNSIKKGLKQFYCTL